MLKGRFEEHYGSCEGCYLVRAPGRVNLMGDHIDYNGLSVLPMALQRHVAVLYKARQDTTVQIASTNPAYPPRRFDLEPTIEPFDTGDWGNYAKAAVQGIADRFAIKRGFDAVVHSDIPVAAGLSSSSALLVASALAALHANDHEEAERLELAELLARAEHYVGTKGGGMDQAICLAARRNSASRIDFNPLRLTAHPIPPEWKFIVAFSTVRAPKTGAALETYNARTRECREALEQVRAALAPKAKIESYPALLSKRRPRDLFRAAGENLDDVLLRRFRHVVSEAERVGKAEDALAAYDLRAFGRLMKESHKSLSADFEVSCPELDELVKIASSVGAVGARLTGAGLGGCIVALCPQERAHKVLNRLTSRFYEGRDIEGPLEDQLFVAEPCGGAEVHPV